MSNDKQSKTTQDLPKNDSFVEFDQNPYDLTVITPADVMRIFYQNDQIIIPVVSKRGILLGVLFKKDVTSELSDIARTQNVKIDQFISNLVKKVTFEEVIDIVKNHQEFVTINLFGEEQKKMSRMSLLNLIEHTDYQHEEQKVEDDKNQKEMDFLIYLLLEHLPRPLYALNEHGNTFFYNSYFEEMYEQLHHQEIDVNKVEKSLSSNIDNDYYFKHDDLGLYFYNKSLKFYYEKIPMRSNGKIAGYLIYCAESLNNEDFFIPGAKIDQLSYAEIEKLVKTNIFKSLLKYNGDSREKLAKNLKLLDFELNKILTDLHI